MQFIGDSRVLWGTHLPRHMCQCDLRLSNQIHNGMPVPFIPFSAEKAMVQRD